MITERDLSAPFALIGVGIVGSALSERLRSFAPAAMYIDPTTVGLELHLSRHSADSGQAIQAEMMRRARSRLRMHGSIALGGMNLDREKRMKDVAHYRAIGAAGVYAFVVTIAMQDALQNLKNKGLSSQRSILEMHSRLQANFPDENEGFDGVVIYSHEFQTTELQ